MRDLVYSHSLEPNDELLTPKLVSVGLLLFLGLSPLLEWVVSAWFKPTKPDYLMVQPQTRYFAFKPALVLLDTLHQ